MNVFLLTFTWIICGAIGVYLVEKDFDEGIPLGIAIMTFVSGYVGLVAGVIVNIDFGKQVHIFTKENKIVGQRNTEERE